MNKFYEFQNPYYAMIAAPTEEQAVELYREDICDLSEDWEEENNPTEIALDEARKKWDERFNKEDDTTEIGVFLEIENGCSMLIDGSLM